MPFSAWINALFSLERSIKLLFQRRKPNPEEWPSGLRWRSWKPLWGNPPGVRIPPPPLHSWAEIAVFCKTSAISALFNAPLDSDDFCQSLPPTTSLRPQTGGTVGGKSWGNSAEVCPASGLREPLIIHVDSFQLMQCVMTVDWLRSAILIMLNDTPHCVQVLLPNQAP